MITLREARPDDALAVWRWNCAPDVRARSTDPREVSPADHMRWYEARLRDTTSPMWIVEADGIAVGVLRLDRRDSGMTISIALDRHARGRGIGRAAIALACLRSSGPIIAEIQPTNLASRACFEACGFVPVVDRGALVTYRWSP